MDENEHEQLDEIHHEVRGSNSQLGKIAERTRNIEKSVETVKDDIDQNREDINDLQSQVKRNSTIINAVTVGMSGILLWVSDKLSRFSPF